MKRFIITAAMSMALACPAYAFRAKPQEHKIPSQQNQQQEDDTWYSPAKTGNEFLQACTEGEPRSEREQVERLACADYARGLVDGIDVQNEMKPQSALVPCMPKGEVIN